MLKEDLGSKYTCSEGYGETLMGKNGGLDGVLWSCSPSQVILHEEI